MDSSSIKIACIGAGYFSIFHIEAWTRLEGVELIAICDSNKERAQVLAAKYSIPKVYTDYRELIEKERPDVLDVITPPDTHLEICTYAAKAGIHLICQKPLAPTYEEAAQLVEQVETTDVRMMVHENFRFPPWFRKIKQELKKGTLGDRLHLINFRFRTGDGWQSDAYMNRQPYFRTMPRLFLYETGIHYIDIFRSLAGDIERVYATMKRWNKNINGEDAAMIQMEFTSGALGLLDASRFSESLGEDPRLTFGTCLVEGNKGAIRLYPDGNLTLKLLGQSEKPLDYKWDNKNFSGDCVFATQSHFLEAFRSGTPFETEGRDYLRSLRVQEAIYQSAENHQVVSTD